MDKLLDYNGAGDVQSFWFPDTLNTCKAVSYETEFSIYNPDDYKRCVCWNWGDGPQDCPQDSATQLCNWTTVAARTTEIVVPVNAVGELVEFFAGASMATALSPTSSPKCFDANQVELQTDYGVIELISDN